MMSVKVANVTSATVMPRDLRRDIQHCRIAGLQHCRKERRKACALPFLQSCNAAMLQCQSLLISRHPRGGTVRLTDCAKPCAGIGSDATPPPVPTLPPPSHEASP